ncbi:zinc finger A20 and AN1 domain-containing stress-associated protein 9-like [Lycium barbarum]|uniref:zinc finger A20 and AN1 domain-containing stress-associated protein 9-like n=1 Tax=Lycium barbarum TaxID=112863 RepID=UPI00293E276F|nr:zinc finger A20 and AN1 domain-containing stress-associated protein 9-like [Lycium barbarum]
MRESKWESLIEDVSSFCVRHDILIPEMDKNYHIGKSKHKSLSVTYSHHLHVEVFNVVIDLQLAELNSRFDAVNTDLLLAFLKEKAAKDALALSKKISSLTIKTGKDDSTILKSKTQRCMVCKKKVGLIGLSCKCGQIYCRNHRYPEEHACNFDFKSIGRAILAKENPLCKADKLENRI